MKKRILSLLVVCLMITSFAVVVNAAEAVTLTVATVDGTAATTSTNLDVAIMVDKLPSNGISVIEFDVLTDYEKIKLKSLGTIQKGDIVVGAPNLADEGYTSEEIAEYAGSCSAPAWPACAKEIVNAGTLYKYGYANTLGAEGYYNQELKGDKNTLFKFRFVKTANDVTGFANVTISNVKFYDVAGDLIAADVTVVNGGIQCSAEATKYTVTASAGANGSISPAGATEATEGTKIPYTITADAGYVIDKITIDGVEDLTEKGNASATYEYTVGTSNGTISVTFKAEEKDTTITTMPNRYKDGDAIYTLGKVVEGTNGCSRYGVAVYSVKRDQEVYYSGSGKTAEGFYVVGFRGTAFDSEAATRAFADTDDGRIFGDSVTAIYGE